MKVSSAANFQMRYGPWAVVAGASEGLGAEFAAQLAVKGLNLVLVARRADKLAELAGRLSEQHAIQVRCLSLDLALPEAVSEILTSTQGVEIGLLVYNAAFSAIGPFWERSIEDHLRELDVNCRAPLALAYAFGRQMIPRRRGGLILLSSLSATQGSAFISNYAATKGYNLLLAEGLWEELRGTGVDALACCPGATETPGYLASLTGPARARSVPSMSPAAVVAETLAALGKQPSVITGRTNRWAAFLMRRVLPRRIAVQFMGSVLRKMYMHGS